LCPEGGEGPRGGIKREGHLEGEENKRHEGKELWYRFKKKTVEVHPKPRVGLRIQRKEGTKGIKKGKRPKGKWAKENLKLAKVLATRRGENQGTGGEWTQGGSEVSQGGLYIRKKKPRKKRVWGGKGWGNLRRRREAKKA